MTDSKDHKSPAEASKAGLDKLKDGRHEHGSTAHTPAVHPNGAKFEEDEIYRGEPKGDLQK
jgi:hypothetical protein